MTIEQKKEKCILFFEKLRKELSKRRDYVVVPSCNGDFSTYLVLNGTEDQISYYGKPIDSFRISDHWNWYSSTKKCSDSTVVQCRSVDIPWTRKRDEEHPEKATRPIFAVQVAYYGLDHVYHHVFGDKFDRKTKSWTWKEMSPEEAASLVL